MLKKQELLLSVTTHSTRADSQPGESLQTAVRHCMQLTRRSGSSFLYAFYSLPRQMFRDMCVLYAFMRVTDDLGDDETESVEQRRVHLQHWREQLLRALNGNPGTDPVLFAMADVSQRHQIPQDWLLEVICGVESDLAPREFEGFAQLERYCYQVAGVVGLGCLKIWGEPGVLSPQTSQQALACGTAFQLTNILRDLTEDAARNRLYLPIEDLQQFGVTREALACGRQTPELRALLMFETQRAWSYYHQAAPLLRELRPEGRLILSGFMRAYSQLLREIQNRDYDVFTARIRLSRWQKICLATRSLLKIPARIELPALQD